MWESMATAISGDLVVDVDDLESFITSDNIQDHGGRGGNWVGEVVDNGNGAVSRSFDICDNLDGVTGLVGGVVYLPAVVGSDAEGG